MCSTENPARAASVQGGFLKRKDGEVGREVPPSEEPIFFKAYMEDQYKIT